MHHPQIVVLERDGLLARQLAPLAEVGRWTLRPSRQLDACLRLLGQPGPSVLVVKVGRPPDRELAFLARVGWELPAVATVAVGDPEDAVVLAGLAWDVGVDFALFPPLSRDLLPELVAGLMQAAVERSLPAAIAAEPVP